MPSFNIRTTLTCLAIAVCLLGCAAAGVISTVAQVARAAMEITGIKKEELPATQKLDRKVRFDIYAASKLNTTASDEPLALVAKIYKLKQNAAFEQATYEAFLETSTEKSALGPDLVEVKEVVLVPGQHYIATENVSADAPFIGVVALFRAPNAKHWRATFSSASAEELGINISMMSCVMLVNSGDPQTQQRNKALSANKCY